jgi:hypothetical protein
MNQYLELHPQDPQRHVSRQGRPDSTKRAVALTRQGIIVFGTRPPQLDTSSPELIIYDDEVERQRRLVADTALAQIVIQNPDLTRRVLNQTTNLIRFYWNNKKTQIRANPNSVVNLIELYSRCTKYIYGQSSFGRRDPTELQNLQGDASMHYVMGVIDTWFGTVTAKPSIPQLMSLHFYFLTAYNEILGPSDRDVADPGSWGTSPEWRRREHLLQRLVPNWMRDSPQRGRIKREDYISGLRANPHFQGTMPQDVTPTDNVGLLTDDLTIPAYPSLQRCGLDTDRMNREARERGFELYLPNFSTMYAVYKQDVTRSNAPFVASASTMTSHFFVVAQILGNLHASEDLKEYLLAIVAYLVGGGMHGCHEAFWSARLAGIPYVDGKYAEALPQSFKGTAHYERWSTEFWELVRPDLPSVR